MTVERHVENTACSYRVAISITFRFQFCAMTTGKKPQKISFEGTTAMSRTVPVLCPIIHLWKRRFLNPPSVSCLFRRRLRQHACTMCSAKFSYDFSMIQTSFTRILSVYCCEESFI
uniref:Uncharacterized protein n=1 Tax=Vespula pensylvanica TaxID=30213 RepID=A0A834P6E4_VESPE|nr:hypothetical protein H0235_005764 [Vespula pensylvanica]